MCNVAVKFQALLKSFGEGALFSSGRLLVLLLSLFTIITATVGSVFTETELALGWVGGGLCADIDQTLKHHRNNTGFISQLLKYIQNSHSLYYMWTEL